MLKRLDTAHSLFRRRTTLASLSMAFALGAAGCGRAPAPPPTPTCYTVSGDITIGGQPASGARLRLFPTDAELAKRGICPQAISDDQGRFILRTFATNDGAPAGDYAVAITWPDPKPIPEYGPEREAAMEGVEPPDQLQGKFANPVLSDLKLTVAAQNNQLLPTIELP